MTHKSNKLSQEQQQDLRELVLTEFFNLEDRKSVQKSLLTAFKGFLECVEGEDPAFSHTVDTIGEDVFLVCALLDYLQNPGQEESVYDMRGILHFTALPSSGDDIDVNHE